MIPTEAIRCRTWAEISLDAVRYNFRAVRSAAKSGKVCCVIKANAYGHDAQTLARVYEEEGADFFAVSNIEEALQLRNGGVKTPILILGYTDPRCAETLAKNGVSQCVHSLAFAKELSENAVKSGVTVNIHIKIDSGMGRIGFVSRRGNPDGIADALAACRLAGLRPEGIFTHFASADEAAGGRDFTLGQYEGFMTAVKTLEENGVVFDVRHCANSAGIFDYPETHLDMVRAGIVLYGFPPSDEVEHCPPLRPVMTLKTVISHIKTLKKGETVSYGRTFTAPRDMKVATVPIGYADGLWRSNAANGLVMLIGGKKAPVLGRICMDQCMLDVTDIEEAVLHAVVTVYGEEEAVSVSGIASRDGTIPYEILCAVGARVPRVFIENGKVTGVSDALCPNI